MLIKDFSFLVSSRFGGGGRPGNNNRKRGNKDKKESQKQHQNEKEKTKSYNGWKKDNKYKRPQSYHGLEKGNKLSKEVSVTEETVGKVPEVTSSNNHEFDRFLTKSHLNDGTHTSHMPEVLDYIAPIPTAEFVAVKWEAGKEETTGQHYTKTRKE